MSWLTAKLGRFSSTSSAQWGRYLEAYLTVIISSIAVKRFSQRRIKVIYGVHELETPYEVSTDEQMMADSLRDAIYAAQLYCPWEVTCVMQAVAAKWMFNRRGIASTVYVGFRIKEGQGFDGHAWLRVGQRIVTGAPTHREYKVVALYGSPDP